MKGIVKSKKTETATNLPNTTQNNSVQPTEQSVKELLIQTAQQPASTPVQETEKAFKAAEMSVNNINDLAGKLDDFKEAPKIPTVDEAKRRGRKPGQKNAPKPPIDQFVPKQEQQVFAGAVISGIVLLTIVDAFIPFIIVSIHNKYKPNQKIQMKDLQISSDVKKELAVVADEVIKTSNLKISPTTALMFSLAAAYGTAYMAATTKKPDVKPQLQKV